MVRADPTFDPVAASKDERKARKLKNEGQRLKNLQRAAATASTSTKTATSNLAERESRKKVIERELKITKTSTASMGKFDEKLQGETKEKNVKRKVRCFWLALLSPDNIT
jgi:regulator of ribosome biosynthesis